MPSSAFYRAILDSLPDEVFVRDSSGHAVFSNKATRDRRGAPAPCVPPHAPGPENTPPPASGPDLPECSSFTRDGEQFQVTVLRRLGQGRHCVEEGRAYVQNIIDNIPLSVMAYDQAGTVRFVNRFHLERFAQNRHGQEFFLGKSLFDLPGIVSSGYGEKLRPILKGERLAFECMHVPELSGGGEAWQSVTNVPFFGEGRFLGGMLIRQDITELKRSEMDLRKSEERLRIISDHTYGWEYWRAPEGGYLWVSPACERISGYAPEEFTGPAGMRIGRIIHPDDKNLWESHLREVDSQMPEHSEIEFRILAKNGEEVWISHLCKPIYGEEGQYLGRRGCNRDVTSRRLASESIRRSLKEKEVLLKEIHHRVKNNMQIISSLLSLHCSKMATTEGQQALEDSRLRVLSMAAIHDHLYRFDSLSEINVRQYLEDFIPKILATYCQGRDIRHSLEAGEVLLGVDQAIPFGLIVNEIVTNAVKHAFDGGAGNIAIRLTIEEGQVLLVVEDDGKGLGGNVDTEGITSLGLNIVNLLARQLQGALTLTSDKGTRVRVRFPVRES